MSDVPEPPPDPDLDPDVGRADRARPHERLLEVLAERRDVLLAVAVGGALGSVGRYGVAEAFPHAAGALAWSTLAVNLSGAFALGVLMTLLSERWAHTRLVRPFWGVGVLGGWTTFSTAMLDLHASLDAGRAAAALGYLALSLGLGLPLAILGMVSARAGLGLGGSGAPR